MKYAFTLKHTRRDMRNCTPSDYGFVYTRWGTHGCAVQKVYYEPDSNGVCHAHGVVDIPKHLFRKKLTSIPGMHVKLVECYDEKRWLAYARKLCPLNRICIHDDQCLMDRLTSPLFVAEDDQTYRNIFSTYIRPSEDYQAKPQGRGPQSAGRSPL